FNSGILAGGNTFDYQAAPPEVVARVDHLRTVCERWNVPLPAAAVQFPRRHSAGASLLVGCRSVTELEEGGSAAGRAIPAGLGGARSWMIDAHRHFWDPASSDSPWLTRESAPLRRRFGPEELEPLLREHGVTGTVVVQARHSLDETRWLLDLATSTPFVLGVVGWLDLARDLARQLDELRGPLVGVRHQVHDEPDPAWLRRPDVQRGLRAVAEAGLAYDLLVRARELPAAVETATRNPDLTFVLDHAGKRPRHDASW